MFEYTISLVGKDIENTNIEGAYHEGTAYHKDHTVYAETAEEAVKEAVNVLVKKCLQLLRLMLHLRR